MKNKIYMLIILSSIAFSKSLFAAAPIYEVSDGKNKLLLAGTIHLLRSQDFPPPAEFSRAYQVAQKIYFETNIQKTKTPEFGQRFSQAMLLPNKTTLKDLLNKKNWEALQAYARENQYPLSQTMMFNPATVSILITLHESKKLGVGEGIDAFFDTAARTDNKFIGELESSDDAIAYMKKFAQEDPNKIIESTLSEINDMPSDMVKMIVNWKLGNLDLLDKTFNEKMRVETPVVYQSLIVERNQKWLPQLKEMLKTSETEMVLVGSLHLPGNDGLLQQLKQAGYTVKPYKQKK